MALKFRSMANPLRMFLPEAHKALDAMLGTLKRQNGVALRVIGVGPVCNTDVYQNNKPQNWASF